MWGSRRAEDIALWLKRIDKVGTGQSHPVREKRSYLRRQQIAHIAPLGLTAVMFSFVEVVLHNVKCDVTAS